MLCLTCRAAVIQADSFLNLAGNLVCRPCYYAEQTKLQDQRVEESQQQELGFFAAFRLGKRLLLGGICVLVSGCALLGALRSGDLRAAAWSALFFALGVAMVVISLRMARAPKD